ncbi:MAG: glycosyltransferase family 2 protein [Paludibacter sp.]|nr:glycosyltransferase family 2 protein [Paludibacter sp.]
MNRIPVTVIVPVRNEEVNLPRCLALLSDFDQIIVVDSNSTDRTPEICGKMGVEYVNFEWNGQFPKKRNWALRNLVISNEWVLFLDADEYITDEFKAELREKIQNKAINGYWIKFHNHFMGKQLKYGYPLLKLPLIRKGKGEYEHIDEDHWSHLDMEVHEHPVIEGRTAKFKSGIVHNDFKSMEHYIARHNAYSSWEAHRFIALQKKGFSDMTAMQKIKYGLMKTSFLPVIYFIGAFFLKLGFLDGKAGFAIAVNKAMYFYQVKLKIEELERIS